MARVITKKGDVFEVKMDENTKKYLQYIASDLTQLNSDVIRAFKKVYPVDANPDLLEIINDEVDFYAHCVTKWGIQSGLWEKIGNIANLGSLEEPLFRDTNDCGIKKGEEPVKISYSWYVWRINDKDFTRVGKLEGENRKAEIGVIIPPIHIVHRMKTGKYDFIYPGFE